jgi:hypothetical protein
MARAFFQVERQLQPFDREALQRLSHFRVRVQR